MDIAGRANDELDDNVVRDLYLFFELFCKRCPAHWEPSNPTEGLSTKPEIWADQFSRKFAFEAQRLGWGSVNGDVVCPDCLARPAATKQAAAADEPRAGRGRMSIEYAARG